MLPAPAHLGPLIRSRPRIRDMIRGLLSEQPFLARLDDLVEAASATFLDTLDDSEKLIAHLYLLKAAQVAE